MSNVATIVLSSPRFAWNLYVRYLWNYEPNSWVASTAGTFRILSLLFIAPVAILTLFDVISYVIARTLGVIDDTKASTSEIQHDRSTLLTCGKQLIPTIVATSPDDGAPSILVQGSTATTTAKTSGIVEEHEHATPKPGYSHSATLENEGNLKLSGVDMFSPVPSQPPSPTLSRKDLSSHFNLPPTSRSAFSSSFCPSSSLSSPWSPSHSQMTMVQPMTKIPHGHGHGGGEEREASGVVTPESSYSSISVGSSFAFDRDSGSEDGYGLQVRKKRGTDEDGDRE